MKKSKPSAVARFSSQIMAVVRRIRRESQNDAESWARILLLGAIDRSGNRATPTELALSAVMRSSNLAAALRELDEQGLIVRTPDTADKRKVRVALTAQGECLLYESRARRERWLAEAIRASLTADEQAQLLKAGELLERIAAYDGPSPPMD
ncbi:MarR family winged helix-turn-helix transcriptional regulator [Duganella violaceipulchra]|uniref:DNA-binding MarR family transcriptional regulator n=1 Tax=Duganella violaceipulchra TaxID=2849652 RepID=A0AA41L8Q1_9BURK|nr:MarR family transcriptional regulator [Duganella violaceicalia]MBV6322435.1 winged helix DNA-binding protein [Duganella violaceicalia]MCP2010635.1 DNA-binding MarR family transcriptional regulator [Duganella violaceicalia]